MKQNRKIQLLISMMVIVISFTPFLAMAQGTDPDAPIDGGLSLLLAAGVGYGVKKVRENRKKA